MNLNPSLFIAFKSLVIELTTLILENINKIIDFLNF